VSVKTLKVVNYAVNGAGVGHLTRMVAISRWMRRYATALGVRLEIVFLTTSEADGLLFHERFASFKLPSKTLVADAGLDKTTYLALAKQWVWHSLALLRPDLLVVDSFPRGSFGELLSALDLCKQRAFVFRPMKESFACRADFQAMLPLYDRILVPEREEEGQVTVPDAVRPRVRHVGPVLVRERLELLSREEARSRLGVPEDRLAVYISAGGGGDPVAESQLEATVGALRDDPTLHLVVGAGPLYRGRQLTGERITWLAGAAGGAAELMAGIDLAVCAAGYNTFGELMQAGVPAIFLPQEKVADEQSIRAARAVAHGAAQVIDGFAPVRRTLGDAEPPRPVRRAAMGESLRMAAHLGDEPLHLGSVDLDPSYRHPGLERIPDAVELTAPLTESLEMPRTRSGNGSWLGAAVTEAIDQWRDPIARAAAAEAAMKLFPGNGARLAAAELLGLIIPHAEVAAAEAMVTDELLAASVRLGQPLEGFLELARALDPPPDEASAPAEPEVAVEQSISLIEELCERALPIHAVQRVLQAIARKLTGATTSERAHAARQLLRVLADFNDWAAAATLLKLLGGERDHEVFSVELLSFLRQLRDRREDLYRGVAYLSAAQGEGQQLPSNHELIEAAQIRLALAPRQQPEQEPEAESYTELSAVPVDTSTTPTLDDFNEPRS
jgi:UDP-N-acetylglucosamine--N-acetylmuramyl-(pentapeptide) pyrophosphoryl-undecaprenol N-acetylglucosamine transferase